MSVKSLNSIVDTEDQSWNVVCTYIQIIHTELEVVNRSDSILSANIEAYDVIGVLRYLLVKGC